MAVGADTATMPGSLDRCDALVAANRSIAARRSLDDVVDSTVDALTKLTGATEVEFLWADEHRPTEPCRRAGLGNQVIERSVTGHGRNFGTLRLSFAADRVPPDIDTTLGLIATVAGSAIAMAQPSESASLAEAESSDPSALPDRRRMDRDFVHHTRAGQTGCIVFRVLDPGSNTPTPGGSTAQAIARLVAEAIRDGDAAYAIGPSDFAVLLPGASKPEAIMVAERIRTHLAASSTDRIAIAGGVTAGRHEDPQRLTERALAALDEAIDLGNGTIVADLAI